MCASIYVVWRGHLSQTDDQKARPWQQTCTLEEIQKVLHERFDKVTIKRPDGCIGGHAIDVRIIYNEETDDDQIYCWRCWTRCDCCHEPDDGTHFRGLCKRCQVDSTYKCHNPMRCKKPWLHDAANK